jgi:hypothetical protein
MPPEGHRDGVAIQVARNLKAGDVEACLTDLFCSRGIPEHIRSDNGSEPPAAKSIRRWLNELGAKTVYIRVAKAVRIDILHPGACTNAVQHLMNAFAVHFVSF